MSDLDERARRLLDAARPGHNPTDADAARVRAALKARVLAEPLLIQPLPMPAGRFQPGRAPSAASGVLGKVLIALGVGSALGFAAGLYAAQALWPGTPARPPEPGAEQRVAPATGAAVGTSGLGRDRGQAVAEHAPSLLQGAMSNTESPSSVPPHVQPRTRSSAANSTAPATSPLKAELDGLRRAQELLYQGRPAWAIARLDELDRAGVGSVLLEERDATRTIAECRLGAVGAGKADEYARRFPRSAHLERVRASCAGAPQDGSAKPGAGAPAPKVAPTQTESRGSPHEE
jgi:hypothetical protein